MKKFFCCCFTAFSLFFSCTVSKEQVQEEVSVHLPGQIIHDPNNPTKLVYNRDSDGDGLLDPFFLCGPGDPEGFLYRGRRNEDGTREGDQLELIRKLKAYGGNSLYLMAVRTHGGDSPKDNQEQPEVYPDVFHNPWHDQDPTRGLNQAILDQWEEWFTEMDNNGITIYFFFFDDAINVGDKLNWPLDGQGNLHPEEKQFVQDLVNRFKHHKHLIWCVMEEAQEIGKDWKLHVSKIAEAIQEVDEYQHIIASHQHAGNVFFHKHDPHISQFALQTNMFHVESYDDLYHWLIQGKENAEGRYSIVNSEDYFHLAHSITLGDRPHFRIRCWVSAMADAYVMVYGTEIANTPPEWLGDMRHLQRFFETSTYNQMVPLADAGAGDTHFVLGKDGFDYILYSYRCGSSLGVKNMRSGTYTLRWLDCASGNEKVQQQVRIGDGDFQVEKPAGFSEEVALYLKREDQRPAVIALFAPEKNVSSSAGGNKAPFIEDIAYHLRKADKINVQLRYEDEDGGPGPYTIEILDQPRYGRLEGSGNDLVYIPNDGFEGRDHFRWKVHDGAEQSNLGIVEIRVTR